MEEYIFFSSTQRTFTKKAHILDQQSHKTKKSEIIKSMVFDHSDIIFESNNRYLYGNSQILRNQHISNNPWVKKEFTKDNGE